MTIFEITSILFWASISLVSYTYFGYPLILWLFTRIRPRRVHKKKTYPSVSVIIAVRNEADKIRQKIVHTLALAYPKALREILVASDASDDGTDEIVRQYAPQGVGLLRSPLRKGKEYAQGLAVAVAKGEILVFTDAATMLEPDALDQLLQNFADPNIGAVSTQDVLVDASGRPTAEGLYVKYEMWVRRLESHFHSLVGLSGSCFAMRKELCADWSPTLASDFVGPLRAARRGYRSIAEPSAKARFSPVISAQLEVPRKIRTFLRGITVLMANLDMLNPFRDGRITFQLVSHKLLRFLAPFLLLAVLATSWLLMGEQPYHVLYWTQVGFYALGVIGGILKPLQQNVFIRFSYYFTMVQWTMLVAWAKYSLGHQELLWEPSKRTQILASGDRSTH